MFEKQEIFLKTETEKEAGLLLTEMQLKQFSAYGELLLQWNEKMNLTAIVEPKEVVIKHFLDSLIFGRWLKYYYGDLREITLLDLGTGAGFPGIPLKIALPELSVVLADSLGKRLRFLDFIIDELHLEKIKTLHGRAEDLGRAPQHRDFYQIVTARAVAPLPVLLEYALPLLRSGGRLLAAKGAEPEMEIAQAKKAFTILQGEAESLEKYSLGEMAENRSLLIVKKTGKTPAKYPRQAGKPKKEPL